VYLVVYLEERSRVTLYITQILRYVDSDQQTSNTSSNTSYCASDTIELRGWLHLVIINKKSTCAFGAILAPRSIWVVESNHFAVTVFQPSSGQWTWSCNPSKQTHLRHSVSMSSTDIQYLSLLGEEPATRSRIAILRLYSTVHARSDRWTVCG